MIASKSGMSEEELLADWQAFTERQRRRRHADNVRAGRVGNGFMGRGTFTVTERKAGYGGLR